MKPVLVGIATKGGTTSEPLSPRRASGGRLMRCAKLNSMAYRRSFDRVNLYPTDDLTAEFDQYAADNLAYVLRGRRVVALGHRVATALGLGEQQWFEWELSPFGFVGARMPHPSASNDWWDDVVNYRRASRFLQELLLPCVHVEGPDGSGKTTLVEQLNESTGLKLIPTENPPQCRGDIMNRIKKRLAPGKIADRSSGLISELVYGFLRDKWVVHESDLWEIVRSLVHAVTFVYCRPRKLFPTFRDDESPEHVELVKDNLPAISNRYNRVMNRLQREGGRVVIYDATYYNPLLSIKEAIGA